MVMIIHTANQIHMEVVHIQSLLLMVNQIHIVMVHRTEEILLIKSTQFL